MKKHSSPTQSSRSVASIPDIIYCRIQDTHFGGIIALCILSPTDEAVDVVELFDVVVVVIV